MKIKLKIILLAVFLVTITTSKSQQYIFEANYSNPSLGSSTDLHYLNQNKVGVALNFSMSNTISLLTGVSYAITYAENNQYFGLGSFISTNTFGQSADIPLRLMFTVTASKSLKFFAFGGPNLNVGITNHQYIISTSGLESSRTVDLYGIGKLSRFNLQLGAGAGLQWWKLIVKGGYDFGLNNLNLTNNSIMNQGGWYATIGYEFDNILPKTSSSETKKE